jgi:hypothetical protein
MRRPEPLFEYEPDHPLTVPAAGACVCALTPAPAAVSRDAFAPTYASERTGPADLLKLAP